MVVSQASLAATYYVGPLGDDTSGDGSQAKPFKSLSRACGRATSSGDVIYIAPGSYSDENPCSLKTGVKIQGAGKDVVKISSNIISYIDGTSSTPSVIGNNEISGISFYGSGSNRCIYSSGRSGQKIYDCYFESFDKAIELVGKYPKFQASCGSTPSSSAIYCDDDARLSTEPSSTDWAENVEVYNNTVKDAGLMFHTIKSAKIHHNTIDNSGSLKSGVGNTSYWWNGVEFYANTIRVQTIAWSTIALEVWLVEGNTRFYDNWTNGWFSIIKNPTGIKTPYSWQIVNNTFESDVQRGLGSGDVGCALETCYFAENVLIEGNYFVNTGANKTYMRAIGVWGYGVNKNMIIKNNVIKNIEGDAIFISSTNETKQLFYGSSIYIYNNVIDNTRNGLSQGIAIIDGAGDIDNIYIKNNIFMTVNMGVLIYPNSHSVSGVEFTNNVVYNGKGFTSDMSSGGFSVVKDNFTFAPDINATGQVPYPYYTPKGQAANIVNRGVNVGIPFSGSAPDIGAYEFIESELKPPLGVRVVQ